MDQDERLNKMCNDFTLLNDEQQDYILGVLQAMVFAKNNVSPSDSKDSQAKNRI